MKFKLDENLPIEATAFLREKGHDVHSVSDEQLVGAADTSVALVRQKEKRILLTIDLDFADIRTYPPSLYSGIIVLRLTRQDRDSVVAIIPRILNLLRKEAIAQRLWIMDESRTRIREEP